ncbi:MAG: AmmeMemoRadiSam system radical SAM enzyme [Chloroflexales bacterium]|nr:AmmeMemoRadiSam system radical SAM enzyme [Chloroflexales bacterium]
MITRVQLEPGVVAGSWWRQTADGRIQCDLCPRACKLREGQRGFCFIRQVRNGIMVLSSYGRASGFCVDPIEKKPLNHFYPGTSVLSFGMAGCNLGCKFCQNWDISKAQEMDRLVSWALPDEIAEAAVRAGCHSVAFTYNDPVIFAEYAIDCAHAAHARGLKTVVVSAGYITAMARPEFYQYIDAANIDLKAFTNEFYQRLCLGKLDPVLDTLRWLHYETDVWLEVTTLLIPGYNDSSQEIAQLCDWFVTNLGPDVPLHFTAFHPDYRMLNVSPASITTLVRARQQARTAGLRHVYTGNVSDVNGQSTFCGSCGALLIERNWYTLGRWKLDTEGCCTSCGARLAGHFASAPGSWGARRRKIWLGVRVR